MLQQIPVKNMLHFLHVFIVIVIHCFLIFTFYICVVADGRTVNCFQCSVQASQAGPACDSARATYVV